MPRELYWYLTRREASAGLVLHGDLPPVIHTDSMDISWKVAIAECYIPNFSVVSTEDQITITNGGTTATVGFHDIIDLNSTIAAINDSLHNLGISEVGCAESNGVVSFSIEDSYQVRMSHRLALIFGFTEADFDSDVTAPKPFDIMRPFQSIKAITNVMESIGGDVYPSPQAWFHPTSRTILYQPKLLRYSHVNRFIPRIRFHFIDTTNNNIPVQPDVDSPYLLLHFIEDKCSR